MIDRTSDTPLAGHGETTVISHTLSLCLSSDTSSLSCGRPSEFFVLDPAGATRPDAAREAGVERGTETRRKRHRARDDEGNVRDEKKVGRQGG